MKQTRFALYVLIAAFVWGSAAASPPLISVSELARRADIVIVGDTIDVASAWNPSRTMIFTTVRQRVVDGLLLKGSAPGGEVVWQQPGGQVGNIMTIVHDGPHFVVGERSLLFLFHPSRIGLVPTVNGFLGKIPVQLDAQEQPSVVLWRDETGLYPAPPSPRAQRVVIPIQQLKAIFSASEVR